jgi:Tfp pilus assembly protein PilX
MLIFSSGFSILMIVMVTVIMTLIGFSLKKIMTKMEEIA